MRILPSSSKLQRLRALKLPPLKPRTPVRPVAGKLVPLQPKGPSPGAGASDDLVRDLMNRVAELESEAANRREFDEGVLHSLVYVTELALTTEHYFAVNGSTVTIRTGESSLVLKINGDITLEGKDIKIKGSGDVDIKGRRISEN